MTITGVITAILIGAVVGVLARLILPGKQPIGILLTVVVGIVAALVGTWLARTMGIATNTSGVDWLELLVQLVVAVAGVALTAALLGRRRRAGLLRR
ncbi:GlsB/YeaQ/YmgE family stress response membrane protein [[Mycobacterium] wendilense]|uniref:GlsB/YeaQ/YmgE family stress response membrane protein n=1 Tax=[Mycobacterium] wendilense TaxID=3064284 RepID=A0ABN9P3S8_9MYCO|nr:GlsB/YeaQ/YmgE family stress response membrane protein [Mycolicibacterium sp. MU0050]CAJ1583437.1 GlsB/YeaQ/YmgE family stress response membrane protein [Mycolicibacterium sp. MU0050]